MSKSDLAWGVKWLFAVAVAQYAQIPQAVWTLLILMVLDYASGLVMAFATGALCSEIGRKGLARKAATLLLLFTLHVLEQRTGIELGAEKIVAFGYALNEAISIVENVGRSGVVLPDGLLETLGKFKKLQTLDVIKAKLSQDA